MDARSTRRDDVSLQANMKRLILHSCESVNEGHKRVLVICRDTDVLLLLVPFMSTKAAEVWMISGTPKKRKCYPIHGVSERLARPVVDTG